jgi:probable HAF family extracellular repeat protein
MQSQHQRRHLRGSSQPLHLEVLEGRHLLSTYTITDLGSLGTESAAYGINDAGMVVGEFWSFMIANSNRPFLWDAASGMQDLGTLGGPYASAALGINSQGVVAGRASTPDPGGPQHAFLYDGDPLVDLGTLGGSTSWARSINNAGQVVGFSYTASDIAEHAFLWDADNGMQDLGALGGILADSDARGINDSGIVVGQSYSPIGIRAFRWDSDNGMQDLGTLGGDISGANAINSQGHIVGGAARADEYDVAFFYDGNNMIDIGQPSPSSSAAEAINDSDQIVGTMRVLGTISEHGFVYADGQMQDLNGLIPPDSGFIVTFAHGINNAGQIVGVALDVRNHEHAVLLTPDGTGSPHGADLFRLAPLAHEAAAISPITIQSPASVPQEPVPVETAPAPPAAALSQATDAVLASSHRVDASAPQDDGGIGELDALVNLWTTKGESHAQI